MLEPGAIPTTEPPIRVGIILPEDCYTSISIVTPSSEAYQLSFSGRNILLEPNTDLFFKISNQGILFHLAGKDMQAFGEVQILPLEQTTPQPQSGVLLKNVVSGRDFHWKKYINVTLPGKIIIRRHEETLLVVNELPIEHYLMCVATSEMGAACPAALIEAQTIAARSWMLANVEQKHTDLGMDVCNDDCCQRYQGSTFLTEQSIAGALNTYGRVLMYEGVICDARYSKSCGGVMESFSTIWGGDERAYLRVKADAEDDPEEWEKPLSEDENFKKWIDSTPHTFCSPSVIPEEELKKYLGGVDEQGRYFRWEEQISQQEMTANMNRYHDILAKAIQKIEILQRGGSGRANKIAVHYLDKDAEIRTLVIQDEFGIRQSLHKKFLYSSAFTVEEQAKDKNGIPTEFILKGAGWGHGVGLCQIGALGMSLQGYSAQEIVQHYYPGSELKKIY